ncbi:hypothetical protein [Thermoproteus tenax]|uniref:Uncharacterized protein n=1 Tax=Thermoproteus tenax (strain ATCC 35583 / DSM 2078 / JCM 9277 / NBRC 100435 / Kra 1) TaxID=768679 RepID=G4RP19_THETK|nr:hypothetical protein [Thermoproteus tenax]CCC81313.1 hypothetical protein TTX_0653 [Thermoproteus tenax Kra 1]
MQRITKSKTFVFEAPISDEIVAKLKQWGQVSTSAALTVFTLGSGEVRIRVIRDTPSVKVRRISIKPECGCVLELDEVREFEKGTVYYRYIGYKPCEAHKS